MDWTESLVIGVGGKQCLSNITYRQYCETRSRWIQIWATFFSNLLRIAPERTPKQLLITFWYSNWPCQNQYMLSGRSISIKLKSQCQFYVWQFSIWGIYICCGLFISKFDDFDRAPHMAFSIRTHTKCEHSIFRIMGDSNSKIT